VAGSVKGALAVASLALLASVGCDSTQDKNARAELQAKRELASRELPAVRRAHPDVRVERVGLVRGAAKGSAAIVVELSSTAAQPLTDVPIAVGVRGRGGRRLLNAKRNLDWFQTHVPAIPADGTVTWVFKGARDIAAGDRPFAKVGLPRRLSSASSLPRVDATAEPAAAAVARKPAKAGKKPRTAKAPAARVTVDNASDVPQFGLQVYAYARRGNRYVAAGKTEVAELGSGQRRTVAVPLAGAARERSLRVEAIPTIFD
jgi:hypothetical protein